MFRDYSNFEIEDFAFDESFQKWILDQNSDQVEFWQKYMDDHPHQIDKILAARALVLQLKQEDEHFKDDNIAANIWNVVSKHIENRETRLRPVLFWMKTMAAAVVVIVGFGLYYGFEYRYLESESSPSNHLHTPTIEYIEIVSNENETKSLQLPDGSQIVLEENSKIRYPYQFDSKERSVQLDGEAYFDIARNPKQPFIIFANKTVVKVLGTSFRVMAHENSDKVIVAVKSGKVSVFERKEYDKLKDNSQMTGLVLMANQQAEFSNELEKFSKMIVPEPMLLDKTDKKQFDFDRTPLSEVFHILQNAYGIEIIYEKELVENRILKVSLEDESLTEKLDIICQTMGLKYQIVDARILIENQ